MAGDEAEIRLRTLGALACRRGEEPPHRGRLRSLRQALYLKETDGVHLCSAGRTGLRSCSGPYDVRRRPLPAHRA